MARAKIEVNTNGLIDYDILPVLASEYIFQGEVISNDTSTKYAKAYQGTDTVFAGIAQEQIDSGDINTTSGGNTIKVISLGKVKLPLTGVLQADVGRFIYCAYSSGQSFSTSASSNLTTGVILSTDGTGYCWVKLLANAKYAVVTA